MGCKTVEEKNPDVGCTLDMACAVRCVGGYGEWDLRKGGAAAHCWPLAARPKKGQLRGAGSAALPR